MNNGIRIIAGPCSAESPEQVLQCANSLSALGVSAMRAGIWKPRTRPGTFEGPGDAGLEWLVEARKQTGIRLAVEVANTSHVQACLKAGIDILWIGARTTTSPFAVQEIAESVKGTGIEVMVKNPVNPDIDLWEGAIERIAAAGIDKVSAIHRGFSSREESLFRNAPKWEIPIELRRRMPDLPILCDPSHMAGRRDLVTPLAQVALDMNASGLFIEVHPNPDCALSDKCQQLTPCQFGELISSIRPKNPVQPQDLAALQPLRNQIDMLDKELLDILDRRMEIARTIGLYKRDHNLSVLQLERYRAVSDNIIAHYKEMGVSQHFLRSLFETIHAESVRCQIEDIKSE